MIQWSDRASPGDFAVIHVIHEGEVIRFIMINRTMMHHPMHLHGHCFRVNNSQGDHSPLKHTADVTPMTTTVIEFIADEPGDWFFHCHLLYHMMSGMARVVEYNGFTPAPETSEIRDAIFSKANPCFFYGHVDLLSKEPQGAVTFSDPLNIISLGWEAGWDGTECTAWEGDLTSGRYLNHLTTLFAGIHAKGVNSTRGDKRAIAGIRYLLPVNLQSEAWIKNKGEARYQILTVMSVKTGISAATGNGNFAHSDPGTMGAGVLLPIFRPAEQVVLICATILPSGDRHYRARQPAGCFYSRLRRVMWLAAVYGVMIVTVTAQEPPPDGGVAPPVTPAKEDLSLVPTKVDVNPVARDEEIRQRLLSVLIATEWFTAPEVRVEQGVVFLRGRVTSDELKKWAGDLARNTQDVVAVANTMDVAEPSLADWGPAWRGLLELWRDIMRSLPLLFLGLLILGLSVGAGLLAARRTRSVLRHRIQVRLLRNVIADGIGVLVFLIGTYIVLRVSGLTQLALTVVGGTGLVGLAVGIAFRDITENFLASIFLSMQRPFETGDLVEVCGVTGYVQQLNVRTTILMALDGNLVQIPNANVYKSNLRNFTTNSNRRDQFDVGIGYDDAINEAQEIALQVLMDHPAVLSEPEPVVLADSLGKATVNLRVYFWINGRQHSWLKVRSSVIRLVKRAFQNHGISMPDEAREVVFPKGIPITMVDGKPTGTPHVRAKIPRMADGPSEELDVVSTQAEGGLQSEAGVLDQQARQAQPVREGENLLPNASDSSSVEEPPQSSPRNSGASRTSP